MSLEENSSFDAAGDPPEKHTEGPSAPFDNDKGMAEFSDDAVKTAAAAEELKDIDDIAQFGEWPDGVGVSAPSERKEKPSNEKPAEEGPVEAVTVKEDPESDAEKLMLEQEIILAAQAVKEGAEEETAAETALTEEAQEAKEEANMGTPASDIPEEKGSSEGSEATAISAAAEKTAEEDTAEENKENIEEKKAESKEEPSEHTEEETVSEETGKETPEVPAAVLVSAPKKKKRKPIFKNKKQRLLAILFFILGFLLILAGVIMGLFRHLYGLSNYVDDDSVNYVSVNSEITMNADDESKVIEQITDTAGTISEEPRTDANGQEWKKATRPPWQTYMNTIEEVVPQDVANEEDGMYYLLLIGVDKHDDTWYGNSDTVIMVTINYHTRKIWMTSMMRDTAVNVPGIGVRKLNASYANGGAPLLIQTIETNFGIRTDNYAMVSFKEMRDLINVIGGIELRLNNAEYERIKKKKYDIEKTDTPGVYHLWGNATLYHSRNRSDENADFGRTQRNRKILMAIVNKVKSGEAGSILSLAGKLLPYVTHNIPREKVARLLMDIPELMNFEIIQMRIPYDGTFKMQNEFLIPDYALTREMFFDRVVN